MMRDRISLLKSIVGNDPQGLLRQLASSDAECRLPNGTTMKVSDVIKECEGKSPADAYRQFGLDFSQIRPLS